MSCDQCSAKRSTQVVPHYLLKRRSPPESSFTKGGSGSVVAVLGPFGRPANLSPLLDERRPRSMRAPLFYER